MELYNLFKKNTPCPHLDVSVEILAFHTSRAEINHFHKASRGLLGGDMSQQQTNFFLKKKKKRIKNECNVVVFFETYALVLAIVVLHQHILGLEIAMHHICILKAGQSLQQLNDDQEKKGGEK